MILLTPCAPQTALAGGLFVPGISGNGPHIAGLGVFYRAMQSPVHVEHSLKTSASSG
jgi:hypothetical protein